MNYTTDKIMVFKNTSKFNDSDEYGFKKMLDDVIKNYTCPECQKDKGKLGFFVWENEEKGLAICGTCGFKKQFKPKSSSSNDSK